MDVSLSHSKPFLQKSTKSASLLYVILGGKDIMKRAQKIEPTNNSGEIFDDFVALTLIVQKSFAKAVKKAVAENDKLGIPTPYSKNGNIFYRQPHKATRTVR